METTFPSRFRTAVFQTFILSGMTLICPRTDPLSLHVSSALMYNLRLHPQKHTTVRYRSFSFTALLHQIPTHCFNPNSSESSVSLTLLIAPHSSCYQIITRQLQMFIMFSFNCDKQHESVGEEPRVCPAVGFFPLSFHVFGI